MLDKILTMYSDAPAEFIACVVIACVCSILLTGCVAAMAPMAGQGDEMEDVFSDDA